MTENFTARLSHFFLKKTWFCRKDRFCWKTKNIDNKNVTSNKTKHVKSKK